MTAEDLPHPHGMGRRERRAGDGLIRGQVDFTVFDLDREDEAAELTSRLQRIDNQIADLRRTICTDLREALLNLESAAEQETEVKQGQNWGNASCRWQYREEDAGVGVSGELIAGGVQPAREG